MSDSEEFESNSALESEEEEDFDPDQAEDDEIDDDLSELDPEEDIDEDTIDRIKMQKLESAMGIGKQPKKGKV